MGTHLQHSFFLQNVTPLKKEKIDTSVFSLRFLKKRKRLLQLLVFIVFSSGDQNIAGGVPLRLEISKLAFSELEVSRKPE